MTSSMSSFEAIRVHKRSVSESNSVSFCDTAIQPKYEPFYPPRAVAEPFTIINPNGLRSLKRPTSRIRRINPNIVCPVDPLGLSLYTNVRFVAIESA